jgi:hypothetical protein
MQKQQKKCPVFRDENYVPIVEQACNNVVGFRELYKELERSIKINGKSKSALENYSRQLAHLSLHYNRMPLELDAEEVMDYLYQVKSNGESSDSFFRFTVHGMRYACKMRGSQTGILLSASFRFTSRMTPLLSANGWTLSSPVVDFHHQVINHARHTMKGATLFLGSPLIIKIYLIKLFVLSGLLSNCLK